MVEIPDNVNRLMELQLEPKAEKLLLNRLPVEVVLLASIAISLRRIAKDLDKGNG